jgi:AcrR family transcriptional regulator
MVGKAKTPSRERSRGGFSDPRPGAGGVARTGNGVVHELPRSVIPGGDGRASGRERVIEIQRTRLLAALFEVSAERGAGNVAVAHIVAHAGVSRRTFYELFADREECFLAGFDDALARASRYALEDYDPVARWVVRLRSALTGLLRFLELEHGAGQLLVVGSLGAGPRVLERRQRILARIITVMDEGRGETKSGHELQPLTAEGVIGGALSILHTRMLAPPPKGTDKPPPPIGTDKPPAIETPNPGDGVGDLSQELTGPLMSMLVLPYLGPATARRELTRPVSKRAPDSHPAIPGDPLRDIGMRLTYRTIRVLTTIADNPGSSNREIGHGAEIEDQGQISKLLARLQRLELIHNTRPPTARGAPNAWKLTNRGQNIQHTITQQPQDK